MKKRALSVAMSGLLFQVPAHAAAVGAMAVATSGDAQTNSTAPAAQSAGDAAAVPSDQTSKISEIVVTATRRAQSSERVPISMSALGQKELTERGITSIADIASVTPGLTFQLNGFSATLTVISFRGLESLFGASTVGVYLDDTPIMGRLSAAGNVGNPYPSVFDLKQIEVERGPQGTLFGAGSETGTLRYIPNEPSLTKFSGIAHADVAATEHGGLSHETGVAFGGPLVEDRIGFRASIWERTNGGYVNQVTPWNGATVARDTNVDKTVAARLALAFKVAEDIKITPAVFFQQVTGDGDGRFDPNFSNPGKGEFNGSTLLPETWKDRFVVPTVKLEAHLPFADLTGDVSYFNRKVDLQNDLGGLLGAIGLVNYGNPLGISYPNAPGDVSPFTTGLRTHGVTEELRLASNHPGSVVTWVVGVFHDDRTQQDYQLQYSHDLDPTGKEVFYTVQGVHDQQTAAFAQVDLHVTSKLTLTAGERIARTIVNQYNINGTGALDATPAFARTRLAETPSTPHASINYQADRHNMFYASYSQGFRVGGGNNPLPSVCGYTGVPTTYTSDRVTNYEIGNKSMVLGGHLKIDASVFHIKWANIQQLAQPACGISYTFNAGAAVSNGFDLATEAVLTDHLRVNLNVGYAKAHLTQNVYDANGIILAQAGDGIGYLPFVNSPWNVTTTVNYALPIFQAEKASVRLEYRYNSRNPGPFINQITNSPNYAPQESQDPATNMLNGGASATLGKIELGVYVNNILNAHPLLGKYGQAILSAPTYSTFRPRTFGLNGTLTF